MIYSNKQYRYRHHQRGVTLVVGMIMLILMTLLALAAISISTGNLKIVGNMQYQQEATSAAQAAINQVFSKGSNLTSPATAPTSLTINVNGTNYPVALSPPCLKSSLVITISELSVTNADDLKCLSSSTLKNSGIMGQNTGGAASDCSRVTWQVTANVSGTATNANVELVEGASLRMDRILADAYKMDSSKTCN
jgi:Tfp pilus assembly protein PilX